MKLLYLLIVPVLFSICTPVQSEQAKINQVNDTRFSIKKEKIRKLVSNMGYAFVTNHIMINGNKIGYMYREKPDGADDSGWRFFSGNEIQVYLDQASNINIYDVNTVANYDSDVIPYLNTPAPCAFEIIQGTNKYRRLAQ